MPAPRAILATTDEPPVEPHTEQLPDLRERGPSSEGVMEAADQPPEAALAGHP